MKAEDVLLAGLAFAAIVAVGLAWRKLNPTAAADAASSSSTGAGGPYPGGSWFTPEMQSVWAVPDEQLPAWAEL